MNATAAKITSSVVHLQKKENKPFFSKSEDGSFFSKLNKSPQSFFSPATIQPKLTIGQPNDIYEKEADSMADKVVQRLSENKSDVTVKNGNSLQAKPIVPVRGITPFVQTKCAGCEQEEKLQKKEEEDDKNLLKDKLQTKPMFESNAEPPPDDEKNIQRKCKSCACEGSLNMGSTASAIGSPKLESSKRGINNLKKKKFFCPPVSDSYANIGLKGEGTIGLTSIDKSSDLMCVPQFTINAKAGHGTLKKLKVSLKMNSKFSKQETEAPLGLSLDVPGCKAQAPAFVNISKDISQLAQVGEQEHCDDVNLAFKQTLLPCSIELNKFAGQKFAGKTFEDCYKSLVTKIGFDPIDCSEEFLNLSNKTEERDTQGLHDFDFKVISKDCNKVVTEFVKAKTNKVGDKSVAPDKWIPSSMKCAKPQPAPALPAKTPTPTPTPKPEIKKKCAECDNEEKLQTKMNAQGAKDVAPSIESALASSKGSGSPLPEAAREQMESSFGSDFSSVRIHNNNDAAQMNDYLSAQAFTHGSDIYFNEGKYDINSATGNHLLAHELTHTLQQRGAQIKKDDKTGDKPKPQEEKPGDVTTVIPLKAPILLNWNFKMPEVPKTPDFSEEADSLNALEIAKLEISKPSFVSTVESADPAKDKSSFLKELVVDFKPVFTYNIAKELNELATTGSSIKSIQELPLPSQDTVIVKRCFRKILSKIQIHALQHFKRYDAVVAAFRADFIKAIENMPSSKKPYSMKKAEMEAYVTEFMLYQVALLQRKLWEDACDWEKQDYSKLLKDTCWGGRFQEQCGTAPEVPSPPAVLIKGR